jgi:hypothetical protein
VMAFFGWRPKSRIKYLAAPAPSPDMAAAK